MAKKDDLLNFSEKKSIKKPLIYGIIAFLVFIIGVFGYAIYRNTKQENVVIPPQIEQKQDSSLFQDVPIETEDNTATDTDEKSITKKLIENDKAAEAKAKPQADTVKQQQKTSQSTNVQKVQKPVEESPKPAAVTNKKQSKQISSGPKNYYVQVAALMTYAKPNQNFLNLIKKEGYSYRLYKTHYYKNGKKIEITKILIGPFSKSEVRKELPKIKKRITQSAFVFKVK